MILCFPLSFIRHSTPPKQEDERTIFRTSVDLPLSFCPPPYLSWESLPPPKTLLEPFLLFQIANPHSWKYTRVSHTGRTPWHFFLHSLFPPKLWPSPLAAASKPKQKHTVEISSCFPFPELTHAFPSSDFPLLFRRATLTPFFYLLTEKTLVRINFLTLPPPDRCEAARFYESELAPWTRSLTLVLWFSLELTTKRLVDFASASLLVCSLNIDISPLFSRGGESTDQDSLCIRHFPPLMSFSICS